MFILLLVLIFSVYLTGLVVCGLRSAAAGGSGSVSILPGFPLIPLLWSAVAAALDWYQKGLGWKIVGAFHIGLAILLCVSAGRSLYVLRGKRGIK